MGQTITANFTRHTKTSTMSFGLKLALVGLFVCAIGSFYLLMSTFRAPVQLDQYASTEAIAAAASNECVALELQSRLQSGAPVLASELSSMKGMCDGIQKKQTLVTTQVKALYDAILAKAR